MLSALSLAALLILTNKRDETRRFRFRLQLQIGMLSRTDKSDFTYRTYQVQKSFEVRNLHDQHSGFNRKPNGFTVIFFGLLVILHHAYIGGLKMQNIDPSER